MQECPNETSDIYNDLANAKVYYLRLPPLPLILQQLTLI